MKGRAISQLLQGCAFNRLPCAAPGTGCCACFGGRPSDWRKDEKPGSDCEEPPCGPDHARGVECNRHFICAKSDASDFTIQRDSPLNTKVDALNLSPLAWECRKGWWIPRAEVLRFLSHSLLFSLSLFLFLSLSLKGEGGIGFAGRRRGDEATSRITSPFSGLCFVLALAGIRRLVVQIRQLRKTICGVGRGR